MGRPEQKRVVVVLLVAALLAPALRAESRRATASRVELPATSLTEDERILHALNRLGYGPRPGDLERVRATGLQAWIERQLAPERIADGDVERRLAGFQTLDLDAVELLVEYPPPPLLRAIGQRLERGMGLPESVVLDMFPELERFNADRDARPGRTPGVEPEAEQPVDRRARMARVFSGPGRVSLELGQAKLVRAAYSERQLLQVMTDFWFNHFNVYIAKGADRWLTTSYERDAIRPYALGNFRDLLGAVAHHPAMLFYLDNWLSSVPGVSFSNNAMEAYADERTRDLGLPPGGVATLILRDRGMDTTAIEDHIQRRQGLNRYRRNAAMRPRSFDSQRDGQQPRRNGLNENYARELLELHTLGVDGGYTQQDVIEVARCFTGWTLAPMHAGQGFLFVPALHDDGKKVVLGKKIKGKGEAQGEAVLDLLATHPSTARFISTKLARRFVADDPPPALVERMAATFLQTDGEIKSVLSTMLRSEEFWSADALQAKVKTPFEFVVSAVRAVDAEIAGLPTGSPEEMAQMMSGRSARRSATGLLHALREMDQPLYGAEPPTGYEDTAADWISSGALLNRMKLSIGLAADRIPGVRVELDGVAVSQGESTDDAVARVGLRLLGRAPSDATVEAIARNIDAGPERLDELGLPRGFARSGEGRTKLTVGWLLASAEFQRK